MTGGMSGGHFVGFFLAIFGLMVLVVAFSRPTLNRRMGSRRRPVFIGAIFALVLLAIFGSGTREIFFHTLVGPRDEVLRRISQNHVDIALGEILQPAFVEYLVRLEAAPPVEDSGRIAEALSVRVGTTVDLLAQGHRIDPPPQIGQTWFFVSYADRENALLAMFRGDAGARRMELASRIVQRVLPQAAAIVALRMAPTDAEKIAILKENPFVLPYAAEWLSSELEKLSRGASTPLVLEIAQKRAYVQQYVNNPGLRDVRAEGRVDPP